jgi:hypothetical protein
MDFLPTRLFVLTAPAAPMTVRMMGRKQAPMFAIETPLMPAGEIWFVTLPKED